MFFSLFRVIASLVRKILLKIVLCGTEQVCSSEITWGRIFLSLFANNLVRIL